MQVLGVGPYEKQQSHKNPTDILADIKATSAPAGVRSHYIKNHSLLVRDYDVGDNFMPQRKFIREARPNSDKLHEHEQFRTVILIKLLLKINL